MAALVTYVPLLASLLIYLSECSLQFVEECSLKGYSPSLLCSSCDLMGDYGLDSIKSECLHCCNKDQQELAGPTKYPFAELVVCACKFGRYPQVQAFVKSDRVNQFPGLTIRYMQGADPIIKLLDKDRNVVETLGIDKWNTDSVEEFFKEHLLN